MILHELANVYAIEDATIVISISQLLDEFPAHYKKIFKKPPFNVLTMECAVWSYEMTDNGKQRAAIKHEEKHKRYKLNKSSYWSNDYDMWDDCYYRYRDY